jgi:hypothetical protein
LAGISFWVMVLFLFFALVNYSRILLYRSITSRPGNYRQLGMIALGINSFFFLLTGVFLSKLLGFLDPTFLKTILAAIPLSPEIVFAGLLILDLELLWLSVLLLRFQPGAQPIAAGRVRQTSLIWVLFSLGMIGITFYFIFWPNIVANQILNTGLPGTALLENISPTGVIVNDQPRCKLQLKVTTASGEVYNTVLYMVISPVYLPQFQPGRYLKIKYDQKDRKKVAVEDIIWEEKR